MNKKALTLKKKKGFNCGLIISNNKVWGSSLQFFTVMQNKKYRVSQTVSLEIAFKLNILHGTYYLKIHMYI